SAPRKTCSSLASVPYDFLWLWAMLSSKGAAKHATFGGSVNRGHLDEVRPMMAGIFGALLLAFLLNVGGLGRLAVACLLVCLALSVGLFLWEIYNPEYGFRMPWLQA